MWVRGLSITMLGAVTLLLGLAPDAGAQRGRLGVLRPAPQPSIRGPLPRRGTIAPYFFPQYWFFNSCIVVAPFFPFFGGAPFSNLPLFAGGQPTPDPTSHLVPDPGAQPVPFPGSHPVPGVQPVSGTQPAPDAIGTSSSAMATYPMPVYGAPVYTTPVYAAAAPVATPQVNGGVVIGDVIVDPTFGFWGGFFGGGIVCAPRNSRIIIR
jgi:hypothetical protein